jgi:NADH dehydrogenase
VADSRSHIVIIGGGFGGLSAARALRRSDARVTLVDRKNHHVFQPLLYQVATAGLSPGDIASPIRWILRRQKNARILLADATAIDTSRRAIALDDGGELTYDFLIVAAGAAHAYFGHDEWGAVAPGLKTLEDGFEIRRRVLLAFERAERTTDPTAQRRLLTFVIVGGGPTGVELAGALAELSRQTLAEEFRAIRTEQARIILLEAAAAILPAFPPALRDAARRDLERLGVEVRTGTAVTRIAEGVVEAGGERFEAVTVLWAAGVAASPLGRSLGAPLDRAGRGYVRPDLTIPEHPEVFVAGDLAAFVVERDASGRERLLPGVAQVAMQQATHAARNIERARAGRPMTPFRYRNYGNMATIGRHSAIADLGWLRLSGYVAWLAWLFIHVLWLTGFRNRLLVLVQWAWAYLTYQRSVRLITESTSSGGRGGPSGPPDPTGSRP